VSRSAWVCATSSQGHGATGEGDERRRRPVGCISPFLSATTSKYGGIR
jgi:hypothetical protein